MRVLVPIGRFRQEPCTFFVRTKYLHKTTFCNHMPVESSDYNLVNPVEVPVTFGRHWFQPFDIHKKGIANQIRALVCVSGLDNSLVVLLLDQTLPDFGVRIEIRNRRNPAGRKFYIMGQHPSVFAHSYPTTTFRDGRSGIAPVFSSSLRPRFVGLLSESKRLFVKDVSNPNFVVSVDLSGI